MKLLFVLLLVLTLQNATNSATESFSQLVQLYHYAETQLNEVKIMLATTMENAALQQKNFSNELRRETSATLKKEFKKLEMSSTPDSDLIRSELSKCADQVDNVIDVAITRFVEILDKAERMVHDVENRLRRDAPISSDIEEINDEVDDIIDEFKEHFEATIITLVHNLLGQLKSKVATLKLDLRQCFDEIKEWN